MAQYFNVKVQFTVEVNGKLKKQSVNYLVDAMSVTEAEARTVEHLNAQGEIRSRGLRHPKEPRGSC